MHKLCLSAGRGCFQEPAPNHTGNSSSGLWLLLTSKPICQLAAAQGAGLPYSTEPLQGVLPAQTNPSKLFPVDLAS